LLQRRGAAGIAILTEPFGGQVSRLMMYQPADRPLPVIVLDHPMQMISQDEMDLRAKQLVDAIERLLDDDGGGA
jgi:hypothetical protein